MTKPIRVNHVAIVAEDINQATTFWSDIVGLEKTRSEYNEKEAVDVAFFEVGNTELEILAPTTDDSGVAKYLNKRGPGFHHMCLDVEDLDATIAHLKDKGIELINEVPRVREEGIRYAFVHPKSTGGLLVELYELPKD